MTPYMYILRTRAKPEGKHYPAPQLTSLLPETGQPHPWVLLDRVPGLSPAWLHTEAVSGHVLVGTG